MEPKVFTRQELFELVWSVPMSQLAARYGISDVALKKRCVKHNIPTPGLGHWAKIQAGRKIKRPQLPKVSAPDRPIEFVPHFRVEEPKAEPPAVVVPTRLPSNLHPGVAFVKERLEGGETDKFGRLTGAHESQHCVTTKCLPRLLRILQALFDVLQERGHEVKVAPRPSNYSREPCLQVFIRGEALVLNMEEQLARKERDLTPGEKERIASSNKWRAKWGDPPRKETRHWTQYPNGNLILRTNTNRLFRGFSSWSDNIHKRLEDQLGRVVVGLEAVAAFQTEYRIEEEKLAAERLAQERARLRASRLEQYRSLLSEDLENMAADWEKSQRLRGFLAECESRLPEGEVARTWLEAAIRYTEDLDPFSKINGIPKDLSPSDSELEKILAEAKRAQKQ